MTESELLNIEERIKKTTKGPWKSMIEGRDHFSGDHFIMTGGEDLYIVGGTLDDQEFIANARQDIQRLIAEVRRLKQNSGQQWL